MQQRGHHRPWGCGVKRTGKLVLGECVLKASPSGQIRGITQMCFHQAGIQHEGSPEFLLCAWPIPIVEKLEHTQGSMGLSKGFVQLQGPHSCCFCLWHCVERSHIQAAQAAIGVGKTRIGKCLVGIFRDCRLEVFDGLFGSLARPGAEVMQAEKIILMGLRMNRAGGGNIGLLRGAEFYAHFLSDVLRHLAFQRQHVAHFALVVLGPKVTIR